MSDDGVTPAELVDVMREAGKPINQNVITYHCRDPRGMLYGRAQRIGRSWRIPADAASDFAARWTRWGSLKRT